MISLKFSAFCAVLRYSWLNISLITPCISGCQSAIVFLSSCTAAILRTVLVTICQNLNNWAPYLWLFNIYFTRILTKSFEGCPCDFICALALVIKQDKRNSTGLVSKLNLCFSYLKAGVKIPVITILLRIFHLSFWLVSQLFSHFAALHWNVTNVHDCLHKTFSTNAFFLDNH